MTTRVFRQQLHFTTPHPPPTPFPTPVVQTFRSYLRRVVLPSVTSKHGEYLLAEVVKRWEHHKIMNKWMFRFFMYLVG